MMNYRKGITPVIAIVLLLLITVGAVGVVYTQFQGLVNDNNAQDQLNQQQQIQQSSYSIVGIVQSASNTYEVTVRNTGDTVLNLTEDGTTFVGVDGAQPRSVTTYTGGSSCDWGALAPGESKTCDTGVSWGEPNDGSATTIELQVGEAVKVSDTCRENGSGACG